MRDAVLDRASRRGTAWPLAILLLASLLCISWSWTPVGADEIDDAARLPADRRITALEALLDKATEAKEAEHVLRLNRVLGDLYLGAGQPYASLSFFEAAAEAEANPQRGSDGLRYAEALLATARVQIESGGPGRRVNPFLRDAVLVAEGIDAKTVAAIGGRGAIRKALVLLEAHYRLGALERAAAIGAAVDTRAITPADRRLLSEQMARVRYAQKRWEAAAQAFEAAGNDLAAAAAWDAARRAERSVPIYARVIAADPANAAALTQARRGARYTGATAALYDALAPIETPPGRAGLPLCLTRAALLEASGRPVEAIPLLRIAKNLDPRDPRALVGLARLLLVTAKPNERGGVNEKAWDEAADAYIEAIRRAPDDAAAAGGLSWIADRTYRRLWSSWRVAEVTARCVRVQQALVAATPDDAWAWANLGNTLRVLGRTEEALAAYAKAREANPFEPGILSDEGLSLAAAGRPAEALTAFEASIRLDGGHQAGRQNVARARWLRGEDDSAEGQLGAALRTARALGRGAGTYRFLLGRIWRTRRDPRLR